MRILLIWAVNAVALLLLPYILPGMIEIKGVGTALLTVLLLGLVNAVIRPIFIVLTLPVTLLTLGLFLFVINALLFWWVGSILSGFFVSGFLAALLGSLIYSFISWGLSTAAGLNRD